MRVSKKIVIALFVIIFATGCPRVSSDRLTLLQASMTLSDVEMLIGEPIRYRGELMNTYGQIIEIYECKLLKSTQTGEVAYYWLYFIDKFLVKLEEGIDWEESSKKIYDTHFILKIGPIR